MTDSGAPSTRRHVVALPDEAATLALGAQLARVLPMRLHLHLHGDLGAGKTTFVRGVLRALGHAGPVRSPTYALVESYVLGSTIGTREHAERHAHSRESSLYFQHFDFYRFNRETDWLDAGFRELLASDAVCAVEWPERAGDLLPPPDLDVRLAYTDSGRDASIEARTPLGLECLAKMTAPTTADAR